MTILELTMVGVSASQEFPTLSVMLNPDGDSLPDLL
jgi:hypothetical protein